MWRSAEILIRRNSLKQSAVLLAVLSSALPACRSKSGDETKPQPPEKTAAVKLSESDAGLKAPQQESPKVEIAAPIECPKSSVLIPEASVWIGSGKGGAAEHRPKFKAKVPAFCLDKTEVSQEDYDACLAKGECSKPHGKQITCNHGRAGREKHPANCVDYSQAEAYCKSQGMRLPTEVEWERAASGGDERRFAWGDESPDERSCWKNNMSCPIASYPDEAYGLKDMTGNVWEWTQSWHTAYPFPGNDGRHRIYRGGSWSRRFEKWMEIRLRNWFDPEGWGSHLGFRCAKTLEGTAKQVSTEAADYDILEVECDDKLIFNGQRCAKPGEPLCPPGQSADKRFGCQRETVFTTATAKDGSDKEGTSAQEGEDDSPIQRSRSPEFDADCQQYQATRPHAYRFSGGGHLGRNAAGKALGCKNRDVGVGWNSSCCPE